MNLNQTERKPKKMGSITLDLSNYKLIGRDLEDIKQSAIEIAKDLEKQRNRFEELVKDSIQNASKEDIDYAYQMVYDIVPDFIGDPEESEVSMKKEIRFLIDNKDKPKCQYVFAKGPMRGEKCERPVIDNTNFCNFCSSKRKP